MVIVAQDREGPRAQVRALLKVVDLIPGTQDRLLDQVVCLVPVAGERDGRYLVGPIRAEDLVLLVEIALQTVGRDVPGMHNRPADRLLNLGTLRLERAIRRLRKQDRVGALDDLRAALVHMHEAGADPLQVECLATIIASVERED